MTAVKQDNKPVDRNPRGSDTQSRLRRNVGSAGPPTYPSNSKGNKSAGVPRETPQRNTLKLLAADLASVLGATEARRFTKGRIKAGYFEMSLLEQKDAIVAGLAKLPRAAVIVTALLKSKTDRIRAYAVSTGRLLWEHALDRITNFLYRTGALPGAWTQETSQSELKLVTHRHGVKAVLAKTRHWAADPDPAIRRMLAEALRPRGVWCKHIDDLKRDPAPLKPILKMLLDDKSDYVRKAVANNLNDISKDNPDLLCNWIANWSQGKISAEREWIIKRALRTLIRDGHPEAQRLLGFADPSSVEVIWRSGTPKRVNICDQIPFDFTLTNNGKCQAVCRLQVEMHGPGKSNKPRIARYILGEITLSPEERRSHSKQVKFEHKNSVPKIPGRYELYLFLNGAKLGMRSFTYAE